MPRFHYCKLFRKFPIQLDCDSASKGRFSRSRSVIVQFRIRDQFWKPQGKLHAGLLSESKKITLIFFRFLGNSCPQAYVAPSPTYRPVLGPTASDFESETCFGKLSANQTQVFGKIFGKIKIGFGLGLFLSCFFCPFYNNKIGRKRLPNLREN